MKQSTTQRETVTTLVQRAQHGDCRAYEQIMQRCYPMVVHYIRARIGDHDLAEDVAQEVFLYAYSALTQLHEPAAFLGWLHRIVHGQIDRLLRKRHLPLITLDEATIITDEATELLTSLLHQERVTQLMQAVDALPHQQRSVVALFYIREHPQQAISAFLAIPVATVKTRLHYARKRLKDCIVQEGIEQKRRGRERKGEIVQANHTEEAITTRVMRLFRAIIDDDLNTARELLTADPALANAKGLEWSDFWHGEVGAIHTAVIYRRKAMIDLLLAHGADINQRVASNFTVLHFTANMALADVISEAEADDLFAFLLERGAEPDIGAYLWRNDLESVRALLAADPTQANAIGVQCATPLCQATDIPTAQLLLDYGADPFFQLEPLWHQADRSNTPMRWAASRPENPDFFRFLLDYTNTPIDIHLACALGDVAQVQQLLEAEPTLLESRTGTDHVLRADFTPLHVAARYRQPEIAEMLLKHGADPDATTASIKDMTPLHLAVMYSAGDEDDVRVDVPRLLLRYGADVSLRDSVRQRTPLEWAEGSYMGDEKDRAAVAALLRSYQNDRAMSRKF